MMISELLGNFWPYIATTFAALAAVGAAYLKGRRDKGASAAAKASKETIETIKRYDDAKTSSAKLPWRQRLRKPK